MRQEIIKLMSQRISTVKKFSELGSLVKFAENKKTDSILKSLAVLTWDAGVKFGMITHKIECKINKLKLPKDKNIPSIRFILHVRKLLKKNKSKISEKSCQQSLRSYSLIIWLFAVNYGQQFLRNIKTKKEKQIKTSTLNDLYHLSKNQLIHLKGGHQRLKPHYSPKLFGLCDKKDIYFNFLTSGVSGRCFNDIISFDNFTKSIFSSGQIPKSLDQELIESTSCSSLNNNTSSNFDQYILNNSSESSIDCIFSELKERSCKNILDSISSVIGKMFDDYASSELISKEVYTNTGSFQTLNQKMYEEYNHNTNSMVFQCFEDHISLLRESFERCSQLLHKKYSKKYNSYTKHNNVIERESNIEKGKDELFNNLKNQKQCSDSVLNDSNNNINKSDSLKEMNSSSFIHYKKQSDIFNENSPLDLKTMYSNNLKQIGSIRNPTRCLGISPSMDNIQKNNSFKEIFTSLIQDHVELTLIANKIIEVQANEIQELIYYIKGTNLKEIDSKNETLKTKNDMIHERAIFLLDKQLLENNCSYNVGNNRTCYSPKQYFGNNANFDIKKYFKNKQYKVLLNG
uniref:Uncharacterized protein n=1 Tax=Clastoptera arizonana TaxID=38151 RepID=A0A1B6BZL2_9HEMI